MNLIHKIFGMPDQASSAGAVIDPLWNFITGMAVVFFLIVAIGSLAFMVIFRARKGDQRLTSGNAHNTALELFWTIIPTILIVIIFAWGFRGYMFLSVPPGKAMNIQVIAFQWGWRFIYPDGFSSNDLVVPENTKVKLTMSSQDVIHSLYIPDFRVKMDVLPNRYTELWFEPTKTGQFDLYCAEYCGTSHATMNRIVDVKSFDEFETWRNEQLAGPGGDLTAYGESLYRELGCLACHTLEGSAGQCPDLRNIVGEEAVFTDGTAAMVDDNYLRESILEPNAKIVRGYENVNMPTFKGVVTEQQLTALIMYLHKLSSEPESVDGESGDEAGEDLGGDAGLKGPPDDPESDD